METLRCRGYMVPGIGFADGHCLWLLHWPENPVTAGPLTEVWVFTTQGKRSVYIDPAGASGFFNEYHSFDEVIGSTIQIGKTGKILSVRIAGILDLRIRTGPSPLLWLANRMLSERNSTVGRTETGRHCRNVPHRLEKIAGAAATLHGRDLGRMLARNPAAWVGEIRSARRPLVTHCTLHLEAAPGSATVRRI